MTHSNLLEMAAATVTKYGQKTALWNPNDGSYRTWTYEEFWEDVRKTAGRLFHLGVKAGDRIGLISDSRAWWPITDFAIMSLGAVTVPLFPNLGTQQVFEILNHAGVKGVFAQNLLQVQKLMHLKDQWNEPIKFVTIYDTDSGEPLPTELDQCSWEYHRFFDWLEMAPVLSETQWVDCWKGLDRVTLATIVYTSGTTGKPKGVLLTHGNLLANVEGIHPIVPIFPDDRGISYLPLSHIFERTASQMVMLYAGAGIVYSEGIDRIVQEFSAMPPTVFTTVPRLLEKVHEGIVHKIQSSSPLKRWLFHRAVKCGIAARVEKEAKPLLWLYDLLVFKKIRKLLGGRLRLMVVGGAPLAPHIFEFFTALGICVVEGYGLTETSPVIAANPVTDSRKGTVGIVLPNVEVRIAEDGEIQVRGESVSSGYYKNDTATKESFLAEGWFKTGDIGTLTADGYLKVTDRKKNLLVLSTGKNVAPAPIESAILANSLVEQILLVGNGRKFISAIVVPDAVNVRRQYQRLHPQSPRLAWPPQEELHNMLMDAVQEQTRQCAEYERPKEIIIADEPFTVDNELMTPTLKVRTNRVLNVYEDRINNLYRTARKSSGSRSADTV